MTRRYAFDAIFSGPLRGKWPALPLWLTFLHLADERGEIDITWHALPGITGWPIEHIRAGVNELVALGWIEPMHAHIECCWRITDAAQLPVELPRRLAPDAWAAVRAKVFARDDFTCRYCGAVGTALECDHVHPISRGGSNELDNLVTACRSCNRAKRDKTVAEWKGAA